VGYPYLQTGHAHQQGLGVLNIFASVGAVPDMPHDCGQVLPDEIGRNVSHGLRHRTLAFVQAHGALAAGQYPGSFLSAVLQRQKTLGQK
jgi:hypothetical protein